MKADDQTGGAATRPGDGDGLRARKKKEKIDAIREAARHLFTTKGYEATTLREVAELADVGFGTVSSYSKDKCGLLSMLIVDDLRHKPSPFTGAVLDTDLLDQLTDAFISLYRFWAKTPELSRVVLPQMEFPQNNPFAAIIRARRAQTKGELRDWFAQGQEIGLIKPEIDVAQAAETVFAVFTSCLREWIGSNPLDIDDARRRLRYLLMLPLAAIRSEASLAPRMTEKRARPPRRA